MKTYMANAQTVERKWYVVDAAGIPLGRQMIKKLRVYKGAEHNHAAQKPEELKLF